MAEEKIYSSYGDYALYCCKETGEFELYAKSTRPVLKNGKIRIRCAADSVERELKEYGYQVAVQDRIRGVDYHEIVLQYSHSPQIAACPRLVFHLDRNGIRLTVTGMRENQAYVTGDLYFGENMEKDTFAMKGPGLFANMPEDHFDIRCAIGPATSAQDDTLYDRTTDNGLHIDAETRRLFYDWNKKCYCCRLTVGMLECQQRFTFTLKEGLLSKAYQIPFAPLNQNGIFKKPPAGWMTWYAVKFDACEENVLGNVKFQEEHLKEYGADTVWVDWEWYHQDFSGERDDGCDTFHPDKKKYPRGLAVISDAIKEAGFVPALWIGYTNDSCENEFSLAHPEVVLAKDTVWCGSYFYDFSHPVYLNEFLPKALRQVFDWGYEAVKFDTLPAAIDAHEKFHDRMYDPSLTTKEAFRQAMKKTREILGSDVYMLSCSAVSDEDFLWAADIFDAGRVGNDIFGWRDFIKEGVHRIMRFYPLHNIVLYPDPDNVVLREEFNTMEQAISRISFVSILGLPMTFGDDLRELGEERVSLLKKCLPVMDIHPMDIGAAIPGKEDLILHLTLEKPYESYHIVDVFHGGEDRKEKWIDLDRDLHLDKDEYHVFDFWREEYLGSFSDRMKLDFAPCESRVLAFRKKLDRPQLVSTTRHITQGAAEIEDLYWEEDTKVLWIHSAVVKEDAYRMYLYVPEGYQFSSWEAGEKKDVMDGQEAAKDRMEMSDAINVSEREKGHMLRLAYLPEQTKSVWFAVKFESSKKV